MMIVGVIITVSVQSSSITTSLLVPLIGAGIVPLEGAFAVTLGANVGTTLSMQLVAFHLNDYCLMAIAVGLRGLVTRSGAP